MGRYLEYDISSGKIISEIKSSKEPEASAGMGLLEIGEDENIAVSRYVVRRGALVKSGETNAERQERERLRREYGASALRRMASIRQEFIGALIEDNEAEIERLRKEYRKLKVYV